MTDITTRTGNRRVTSGHAGVALGVIALSISLGVPSEAAKVINGKSLKNNSVTSQKIKNNNLTGKDVKNDSLRGEDIKESSLEGVLKTGDVAAFGNASSVAINDFTASTFTSLVDTSFTAPRDGFLYLTGAVSAEDDSSFAGGGRLLYRLSLDGASLTDHTYAHELDYPEVSGAGDSGAATAVVPVSAGAHTVSLDGREVGSGSFILGREVSVLFVPSGAGFAPPARATSGKGAHPQG